MFETFGSLEFFVVELSTFSQPLASAESPVRKEFHDLGDPTMLFQPKFSRGEKALLKRSANQICGITLIQQIQTPTVLFSTTTHHFPNIFQEKISDVTLKNSPQTSPPLVTDLSRMSRFYNQSIKFTQRPTAAKDCFTKSFCLSCGEKLNNWWLKKELDDETLKFGGKNLQKCLKP